MTLPEHWEVGMASFKHTVLLLASRVKHDSAAQKNTYILYKASLLLNISSSRDKTVVWERWRLDESRRTRKLLDLENSKPTPELHIKIHQVRRAAIHWYCETFPAA